MRNRFRALKVLVLAAVIAANISPSFAADAQAVMDSAQVRCAQFLAGLRDIQIDQTMTMTAGGDSSVVNQRIFRKGDHVRTEIRAVHPPTPFGDVPTVIIGDGVKSWVISVMENREMDAEEAEGFAAEKLCWDFQGHDAQAVGLHTVDGRELIEIAMNEGDNSYAIDIDPVDYLIRGGRAFGGEGDSIGWAYSDFREINGGYRLPFQTSMYADGTLLSLLTVDKIMVNQSIPDSLFDPAKVVMPSQEEILQKLGIEQK